MVNFLILLQASNGDFGLIHILLLVVVIYLIIILIRKKPKSGSQKFRGGLNEKIGRR